MIPREIENPGPVRWPYPDWVTPDMEGPAPSTVLPCGCHLRRPDYEAVLCEQHLAEMNVTRTDGEADR